MAYFPAEHAEQVDPALAPRELEYVPDWQSVQLAGLTAPMIEEYVPAWHCVQKLLLGVASPVEYVPEMQLRHLLDMARLSSRDPASASSRLVRHQL